MDILTKLLVTVTGAGAVALGALYFVHMLQLSSYQFGSYSHFLKKNVLAAFSLSRAAAVFMVAPYWMQVCRPAPFYAGIFVIYLLMNPLQKAKKPLVITARVKRLFFTLAVLYAVPLVFWWVSPRYEFCMPLMGLMLYLMPLAVMLANLINRPAEKAVSHWYVNDARKKLEAMPQLIVVGITGSFGKTSTKYFLNALLSTKYHVLMTPGNYNTTLGVVRTVREMLLPTHQLFLCEMGARHKGDIREICRLVKPRYGVLTAIGEQHLESFGSVETICRTKFELIDALPREGMAFLNGDNPIIAGHPVEKPTVFYGLEEGRDYRAHDIRVTAAGTEFSVLMPDGAEVPFRTRLLGAHNVQNITGAIAVAHKLGVTAEQMQAAVRQLEAVPHRMQLIRGGSYAVIDDAYNSNPAGAKAALETLQLCGGTKILVTPGMVELGEREEELNRAFGAQAAEACDYVALVGPRQTEPIRRGLLEAGFAEEKLLVADTLQQAMDWARQCGDVSQPKFILLENDLPDNYLK